MNNKSPFELLFKKLPHYSYLKLFGCLSYILTYTVHRDKFSLRAIPCVFIGYPYGKKAYKFLDLESKQMHISRDDVFYEHIFPFVSLSSSQFLPLSNPDLTDTSSSHVTSLEIFHNSLIPIHNFDTHTEHNTSNTTSLVSNTPKQHNTIHQPKRFQNCLVILIITFIHFILIV